MQKQGTQHSLSNSQIASWAEAQQAVEVADEMETIPSTSGEGHWEELIARGRATVAGGKVAHRQKFLLEEVEPLVKRGGESSQSICVILSRALE